MAPRSSWRWCNDSRWLLGHCPKRANAIRQCQLFHGLGILWDEVNASSGLLELIDLNYPARGAFRLDRLHSFPSLARLTTVKQTLVNVLSTGEGWVSTHSNCRATFADVDHRVDNLEISWMDGLYTRDSFSLLTFSLSTIPTSICKGMRPYQATSLGVTIPSIHYGIVGRLGDLLPPIGLLMCRWRRLCKTQSSCRQAMLLLYPGFSYNKRLY